MNDNKTTNKETDKSNNSDKSKNPNKGRRETGSGKETRNEIRLNPGDFDPGRRLSHSGITEAAPIRYLKPNKPSPPATPRCQLPKNDPCFSPLMEFLATLPRARSRIAGEPMSVAALRSLARANWASNETLTADFGWPVSLLYRFVASALADLGIRVRVVYYTHHRMPRIYFAIADECWDLASLTLQEYWDSIRAR